MSTNGTSTKLLGPLEIKDAEKGEVEAIVATLGVVDHDKDVIAPDAIRHGAKVKLSSYAHDTVLGGNAPVGKGVIHVDGQRAILRGQFFMSTQRGREAFETVKALGPDGEWSVGFATRRLGDLTDEWKSKGAERVLAAIDVFEVSPVLRGASLYTGTLAIKGLANATEPAYPVGTRIRALVNHKDGMKGMVGVVAEAHAGDPPYYAIQFPGDDEVHKWLNEPEVEAAGPDDGGSTTGRSGGDMDGMDEMMATRREAELKRLAEGFEGEFDRFRRTMRNLGYLP